MKLTYPLTLKDWKAMLRLHARQRIGRRIHVFIYDYVFPFLALAGLALLIIAMVVGDTQTVDNLFAPVAALVAIGIIVPFVRLYALRKSFKGMFPSSILGPGYSLDIDDERIVSVRPGVGEATYYWTGIYSVAQDKKMILIDISELLFLGIPVHVLLPDQQIELCRIIDRHLSNGKPC